MAITIKGIRVKSFSVARDDEGDETIAATYQLVSSADKVLATNSLTSKKEYNASAFVPSAPVAKQIADAVAAYRKEVELSLGLDAV